MPFSRSAIVLGMCSDSLTVWAIYRAFKDASWVDRIKLYLPASSRSGRSGVALWRFPRYRVGKGSNEVAGALAQFQKSLEQELTYPVAVTTSQSENPMELVQTEKISSDKDRELEAIVF